jgi:hypothetical protein
MTGESNWAGRGYSRPGPQGQDLGRVQVDADRQWAALEYDDQPSPQRQGDCPLCIWGGPGHSAPFAGHVPDREREAG